MIDEIVLIKQCFPDTWKRKMALLILPHRKLEIKENGVLAGLCLVSGKRITLLCVKPGFRGRGYATKMVNDSKATEVYTYQENTKAIEFYKRLGFKETGIAYTWTGNRVWLEKDTFQEDYEDALQVERCLM